MFPSISSSLVTNFVCVHQTALEAVLTTTEHTLQLRRGRNLMNYRVSDLINISLNCKLSVYIFCIFCKLDRCYILDKTSE